MKPSTPHFNSDKARSSKQRARQPSLSLFPSSEAQTQEQLHSLSAGTEMSGAVSSQLSPRKQTRAGRHERALFSSENHS